MKREKPNADLADRLHKFEVVCKVAIQLRSGCYTQHKKGLSLHALGRNHFGLTARECQYCTARVQNFLADIRNADRMRNAKALASRVTPRKERWQYLDEEKLAA